MNDPKITRLEGHGPAATGLEEWEPMDPKEVESGSPVQKGHLYFNDEKIGLMAGVWDCTPFLGPMAPYDVNEFMLVLEGSVTMILADGSEETISAGEAFVIPKGLICQWKQTEYMRKFFVIFDDASSKAAEITVDTGIIRPQTDGMVTANEITDTSQFIGDVPRQGEHDYFVDPTGQFMVGLWDSDAFERPVSPFNRYELMCILDGSVTLSDGAGDDQVFNAGDAVFVPEGAPYKWKSTEYVRKFYCIFMPTAAVKAVNNAAE